MLSGWGSEVNDMLLCDAFRLREWSEWHVIVPCFQAEGVKWWCVILRCFQAEAELGSEVNEALALSQLAKSLNTLMEKLENTEKGILPSCCLV